MDDASKRDSMRDSLRRGFTVVLQVDPKRCVLPEYLKQHPTVTLEYATKMARMIPDLEAADDGVHATLSFKGLPFKSLVPWSAVVQMWTTKKDDGNVVCRYCATSNRRGAPCTHCGAPASG